MRARSSLLAILLAVIALTVVAGSEDRDAPEASPRSSQDPPRIHVDGDAVEKALLEATRAYLYSDLEAVDVALDRLEAGCRRLSREATPEIPDPVITYDRAFHLALDASREQARRGNMEESFNQFIWIQRGCRRCHKLSRENGLASIGKKGSRLPANSP